MEGLRDRLGGSCGIRDIDVPDSGGTANAKLHHAGGAVALKAVTQPSELDCIAPNLLAVFNVIITKLFTKIEPQNYLSKSRPVPCSVAACDDEFSAAMRE